MNQEEIQLLMEAARVAKLDPSQLKVVNPFSQQGGVAKTMQSAVDQLNPSQAAKWRLEAGESLSLQAAAAQQGITPMTNKTHQELMTLDADYRAGHEESTSRREADVLARMESDAAKLAEARGIRRSRMEERQRNAGRNLARRGGW